MNRPISLILLSLTLTLTLTITMVGQIPNIGTPVVGYVSADPIGACIGTNQSLNNGSYSRLMVNVLTGAKSVCVNGTWVTDNSGGIGLPTGTTVNGTAINLPGNLSVGNTVQLPATTSASTGVILFGGRPYIHFFADPTSSGNNTWIGLNAGNFTLHPTSDPSVQAAWNTAVGPGVLHLLTTGYSNTSMGNGNAQAMTTAYYNSSYGGDALHALVDGYNNAVFGTASMLVSVSGHDNSSFGHQALKNSTNHYNSGFGSGSLYSLSSGASNAGFGAGSCGSITTESGNLCLGTNAGNLLTGANHLIVDNLPRSSGAAELQQALIAGVFDAAVTNQTLTINAGSGITLNGPVSIPSTGNVAAWVKHRLSKVANGVPGCSNANGCWFSDGYFVANATADVAQSVILVPGIGANATTESLIVKPYTACTGTATATMTMGFTSVSATAIFSTPSDIQAGPGTTNRASYNVNPKINGFFADNIIIGITTTTQNVDQLVTGCSIDVWIKSATLP